MTKKRANYLLSRVYKLLKDPESFLRLKRIRPEGKLEIAGLAYPWANVQVVDPRRDILPSTIHESLHLIYPNWTEKKVKSTENQIVMKMSIKQFSNLLFRLAECVSANGLGEVDISQNDEKKMNKKTEQERTITKQTLTNKN